MNKRICLCSFLLLHLYSFCQDHPSVTDRDSTKEIPLEEIAIQSVRAGKNAPVTETTLGKEAIEKNYTGQEMPVILGRTPSVTWYSDGGNYTGYSYFRLRGMDQTRVNFTLNGAPLNEPEDQGAYFSNYPDFLNSVRSVQVQRGVGISTNGTASFAGSVNMESPSLSDSSYTELNASYGSYHTYRISPEFNTGLLKNNWSFYGRYSMTGSDGFKDHSGTKGNSFFLSGGYVAKKGVLKFTAFTGTSKSQMAYLATPDSILRSDYRYNPLSKNENDEFSQSMAMLQYIVPLGKYSVLNASAYYTYLSGGYTVLFDPSLYKYSVKSDFYGGILNYQFHKRSLTINTGLNADDYRREHFSALMPDEQNLLYKNTGHKNEFSAFAKIAYDIKKFTFFADAQYRYAHFSYEADRNSGAALQPVSWQFFNPKIGISYALKQDHQLYFSAGRTGREPTRNDLFAGYDNIDSLNVKEIKDLQHVKPETVIDLEAGIKLACKKLWLNFNLYDMEFKNEIAAIGQLSYIGLPLRKNVASSYRRGIEANMITSFGKFGTSTQLNLSSNRIKTYTTDYDSMTYHNVQPLLTPQIVAGQSVNYRLTRWLRTEVEGRYMSSSFLDNSDNKNFTAPSSLIFNASLNITFLKHCQVSLICNNITDQKYYTSGYIQGGQSYYFPMATRNYFVNFKLIF